MQIYDFVEPELDRFRELCNFSDDERRYFELRSKHKSNIEIAFAMQILYNYLHKRHIDKAAKVKAMVGSYK